MNETGFDAEPIPALEETWPRIQAVGPELASELEQLGGELPGSAGVRLRRVAHWFRGPAVFDDAIRWPDVVAVGLELLEPDARLGGVNDQLAETGPTPALDQTSTSWTRAEIADAARRGACALLTRPSPGRQAYWRALVYPATILVAAWLLWVAFSFWVLPQFEAMFREFGMDLPLITKAVLGLAGLVRRWWLLMVALPIASGLALWLWQKIAARRQTHSPGPLARLFTGRRDSVALWAWHLALLLDSGVAEQRAVETAGEATVNRWLRNRSRSWASAATGAQAPVTKGVPRAFSDWAAFEFMTAVMALPVSEAKVVMLRELSAYNQARGTGNGAWWIEWLSMVLKFYLYLMIFVLVISLFMPLLSLIGGLSRP